MKLQEMSEKYATKEDATCFNNDRCPKINEQKSGIYEYFKV